MFKRGKASLGLALIVAVYTVGLYFFYVRYVPLVKPFQMILIPILLLAFALTSIHLPSGLLFFTFFFPLINNLPYFFGIFENTPHAPTALVLFLFFFLGFLSNTLAHERPIALEEPILKPLVFFSITIFLSGIISFLRYANFYPFLSDGVYELKTNVHGVAAGGALMSVVFSSLNYLSALAFFVIFLNTVKSRRLLKRAVVILCVSTFVSLCFGLFQHLKNMDLGNNLISIRLGLINATFKDALSFGAYIAVVAPFLAGLTLAFKGKLRVLAFLTLPLAAYLVFSTGSKIGLLSFVFALCFFSYLSLRILLSPLRSRHFSLAKLSPSSWIVILLILVLLIGLVGFKDYFAENIRTSITMLRLKDFQAPLKYRVFNLGKLAVSMVRDFPLTGVGTGAYIIEVSNYSIQKNIQVEPESAENYVIQVGSELGLVGVFLVFWIFWEIIKLIRRSYLKLPSTDNDKFVLAGAIAGIISFFVIVQAHTFIGSYEIKYIFWFLVGVVFCLGRLDHESGKHLTPKPLFNKTQKIAGVLVLSLFSGIHLWNSSHSLSLENRAKLFDFKQDFGFFPLEKTSDGREFRWAGEHGGLTVKIEKPIIEIPLHASHPDIPAKPVKVRIYLIKDFFKKKILLDKVTLSHSLWETFRYDVSKEVGEEIILLVKVDRTWNPQKVLGTPDPRNLGVAMGRIEFRDRLEP